MGLYFHHDVPIIRRELIGGGFKSIRGLDFFPFSLHDTKICVEGISNFKIVLLAAKTVVSAFTSVKPPRAFFNTKSEGHNKCDKTVTDKRPVNLDISSIELPLPAVASILHRISGVFLVVGVGVLLWMLDASLASEASFNEIKQISDSVLCKVIVLIVLAGLIYHTVAGIKHLIMDLGYGETLDGGMMAAKLAFGVSAVLIVLVGAWIW